MLPVREPAPCEVQEIASVLLDVLPYQVLAAAAGPPCRARCRRRGTARPDHRPPPLAPVQMPGMPLALLLQRHTARPSETVGQPVLLAPVQDKNMAPKAVTFEKVTA